MINFILPQMYKNCKFNQSLCRYIKVHPERVVNDFSERVNIFAQAGNFPYSFWNGSINTDIVDNHIVLQTEAMQYYLSNNTLLMFDFTNLKLQESPSWIEDPHVKMVLNTFKNKGHLIKVVSSEIKDLIDGQFPGYDYVIEDIGQDYNSDNFLYISIGSLSSNIPRPLKTFYPVFNKCVSCEDCLKCKEIENLQQYAFCEASVKNQCSKPENWNADFWREEILKARKSGYRFFEFGDIPIDKIEQFNFMLIDLLIKPEFRGSFKLEVLKK